MSHAIEYVPFSAKTTKKQMLEYGQKFAEANMDRYESPFPVYSNSFTPIDRIAADREEAEKLLRSRGAYVDGWIRYHTDGKPNARYKAMDERIKDKRRALNEYAKTHSVSGRKAKFVSCPECESRINRGRINGNLCPVCQADLRPASVQKEIDRRKDAIEELERKQNDLIRGKGKVLILAKYEVHC